MRRVVVLSWLLACRGSSPPVPPPTLAGDSGVVATQVATPAIPGVVSAIFAGGWRTCALRGGELVCWGDANHGALGPGVTLSQSAVPTKIEVANVVEAALGESHACARTASGEVWCWGGNEYGQRGDTSAADSPRPIQVKLPTATQLVASGNHTCALAGGKPWCWGIDNSAPAAIELAAIQVVAGDDHACALVAGGTVQCWGESAHLQLGTKRASVKPVAITGVRDVVELAAAGNVTCARSGGTVKCWGEGENAQLANLDRKDSGLPLAIDKLADATRIAVGHRHACALRKTGEVACWGGSDRGSFGFPRACPPDRVATKGIAGPSGVLMSFCAAPTAVARVRDTVALAHGADHACALGKSGTLHCWGGAGYGELGNRDHGADSSEEPIEVKFVNDTSAGASAKAIDVGANGDWSCAVLEARTVKCWGAGTLGQLGPTIAERSAAPVAIAGLDGVERIALGGYHGCALVAGGARCWGYNDKGALGDGTTTKRPAPIKVAGVPKLVQLAASASSTSGHTCALASDGRVWCWGGNDHGQALPGGKPKQLTPTAVPGIKGATQVATGNAATCAIVKGIPQCWGAMPSDKGTTQLARPTPVAGIDHVVELGMGYAVSCARRDDGSVVCWGKRRTPGPHVVPLGGKARAISIGAYGAAAILEDGSVKEWWIEQDDAPTKVDLAEPAKLSCSGSHCCALGKAGEVSCWGGNQNGQLGNPAQGAGGESKRPVRVTL